jgi:hypothetical protein
MDSKLQAIRKRRAKMMGPGYSSQDEIEAGTDYMNPELREQTENETDSAPSLEDEHRMNMGEEVEEEDDDMVPPPQQRVQLSMQDRGLDQGDAILPKGMYEDGDENRKGFMGKAAMMMKNKLKRG